MNDQGDGPFTHLMIISNPAKMNHPYKLKMAALKISFPMVKFSIFLFINDLPAFLQMLACLYFPAFVFLHKFQHFIKIW